ncbi:MAG: IS30 family transposase [Phycisphaera sp.]|nr:IS30 family transposase [Phycisphaera sp.]
MPRNHLTADERYVITHMHRADFADAVIAQRIGRHRATIGRELARNRNDYGGYHYESAQRLAVQRRTQANQRYKLAPGSVPGSSPGTPGKAHALGRYVRDKLRERWSPQQIVERLKLDYPRDPAMWVTHETIYRWVYRRHQLGERWYEQLRRRRPRRRPRIVGQRPTSGGRGQIPGRVGIEQRPAIVNARRRFGDWESDTVEGAKGTGLIVTHVERKSRYTRLGKLKDKTAPTLTATTCALLRGLPGKLRRTSTFDNGKEFADFKTIERTLRLKVYFANPHAPWERGTNENTNGLLRDFFPKGSDFRSITPARLARVEKMLNNRPRKCLKYRTPAEVLNLLPGVALRN